MTTDVALFVRRDLERDLHIAERHKSAALLAAAQLVREGAPPDEIANAMHGSIFADKLVEVLRLARGQTTHLLINGQPVAAPGPSTPGSITVKEASYRYSRSVQHIRDRIREGGIIGEKVNGAWWVLQDSAAEDLRK